VDSPLLEIADALTAFAEKRQMQPEPPPRAISPEGALVESRLHVRTLAEVPAEDCDYPSEDASAEADTTAAPAPAAAADDKQTGHLMRDIVRHASASVASLLYGWHRARPTG
jgi:hypothetical protein